MWRLQGRDQGISGWSPLGAVSSGGCGKPSVPLGLWPRHSHVCPIFMSC